MIYGIDNAIRLFNLEKKKLQKSHERHEFFYYLTKGTADEKKLIFAYTTLENYQAMLWLL